MADGMSLARLEAILDAYGAAPARWPAAERDAALALLAASPEARARQAVAAELDACLDATPSVAPDSDLVARIVAAAPSRPVARPGRAWRRVALTVPLAAAAALAVWLVRDVPRDPAPSAAQVAAAAAALDTLEIPTDALLGVAVLDSLDEDTPRFGCRDGELGCPDLGTSDDRQSRRRTRRNPHA